MMLERLSTQVLSPQLRTAISEGMNMIIKMEQML